MQDLTQELLKWYAKNARQLPWRTTYEPYHVFISELMLQQTQMERGVSYFNNWIRLFPTLKDVANASEEQILHAWEGLGYYRRAHYIHEATKRICEEYNGIIPSDPQILRTFKGLGDYTIAAICGIAFNQAIVTIDTNVDRIFTRLFCIEGKVTQKATREQIKKYAYTYLPSDNARTYNQALMELGALVCKKKPLCEECPLISFCNAYKNNRQVDFPFPKEAQKLLYENWTQLIFITKDEYILIKQRDKQKHWAGLYEFYSYQVKKQETITDIRKEVKKLSLSLAKIQKCTTIPYSYTNHRNTVTFYKVYLNEKKEELLIQGYSYITPYELKALAFPSPYRKAIKEIF